MKVFKLVSGILSIVFSVVVLFQSAAAGLGESLGGASTSDGALGIFVAILMLSGGIVSIAVRGMKKNGGNIAIVVIYLLSALFAFTGGSYFKDLSVWGSFCLIIAVLAIIDIFKKKKHA
jgi:hypothetical protein